MRLNGPLAPLPEYPLSRSMLIYTVAFRSYRSEFSRSSDFRSFLRCFKVSSGSSPSQRKNGAKFGSHPLHRQSSFHRSSSWKCPGLDRIVRTGRLQHHCLHKLGCLLLLYSPMSSRLTNRRDKFHLRLRFYQLLRCWHSYP